METASKGRDRDDLGGFRERKPRYRQEESRQIIPAMTVPGLKSLLAPSRNLKVTVPGVVGVHSSVMGLPAVMEKPSGILNALSFVWASTDDNRTATSGRIESFILSFCTRIAV